MIFPIGSGGLATTGYSLAALRAANLLGNSILGHYSRSSTVSNSLQIAVTSIISARQERTRYGSFAFIPDFSLPEKCPGRRYCFWRCHHTVHSSRHTDASRSKSRQTLGYDGAIGVSAPGDCM